MDHRDRVSEEKKGIKKNYPEVKETENPEAFLYFRFKSHSLVNRNSQRNAKKERLLQVKQFANLGNTASTSSGSSKCSTETEGRPLL